MTVSDYAACTDSGRCTVHRDGHHYATCPAGAHRQRIGQQIRAEQMQAAHDRDLTPMAGMSEPRYMAELDGREERWG